MATIVQFQHVYKSFGDHEALKNIDITFQEGETTVILGPSGSGKSTLLRCINLLEQPERGQLTIAGTTIQLDKPIVKKDKLAIRQSTAMVFQSFNLFPHMKVLENVIEGPVTVLKQSRAQAVEKGKTLLHKVGLEHKMDSYPSQLSGGQQQRVAIARALAMEPQFLLFDEPTSALDPELEGEVLRVLQDLAEEDKSMIIVTHNLNFARRVADRILFLENGEILFDGTTDAFFEHNNNERIQAFIQAMQLY
ncbi:arginine ABC transporter ATP-binding protein ArtP [Lysinibacillus piscis]|uniref:Arginine ABC transporter ATP-binding protein ArtP n=1 Tax=Lysinibacillus piscis TaxID=2518931 RepID=A0ABQ5NN39_9BACI|nr:amino acid ABC transporter ATP-binding protein [Lysinibacillus sp. KH24]GLC89786.1 arginine ABC transporter ATP-binding protein ArtP [Lysinibacillus sp. KH24]